MDCSLELLFVLMDLILSSYSLEEATSVTCFRMRFRMSSVSTMLLMTSLTSSSSAFEEQSEPNRLKSEGVSCDEGRSSIRTV